MAPTPGPGETPPLSSLIGQGFGPDVGPVPLALDHKITIRQDHFLVENITWNKTIKDGYQRDYEENSIIDFISHIRRIVDHMLPMPSHLWSKDLGNVKFILVHQTLEAYQTHWTS